MINIDAPTIKDENEAMNLMIYHLQMAAAYFGATDLDAKAKVTERIVIDGVREASIAFVHKLDEYYKSLD